MRALLPDTITMGGEHWFSLATLSYPCGARIKQK